MLFPQELVEHAFPVHRDLFLLVIYVKVGKPSVVYYFANLDREHRRSDELLFVETPEHHFFSSLSTLEEGSSLIVGEAIESERRRFCRIFAHTRHITITSSVSHGAIRREDVPTQEMEACENISVFRLSPTC